jgi:hypothetical protein
LVGNGEICIQAHFYEATIFKKFNDFVVGHFENGGLVKMSLNASFIITNEFLTSKYS